MTKNPQTPIALFLCAAMLLVPAFTSAQTPAANASALRIVVIAGEDAINIIQQKTAVNPIVEVRDRNNLPVSGVAVTFSVGGQGASFAGGASTLTLTTNAAGQAVVTGLTPTATGAITINASAVVNGQTITAAITQTNFATAAEAAAAGSAGGAGGAGGGASGGGTSGAVGGAGGGIGGMSGATLGIVGGGIAAAGALVATQAGGGSEPAASTGGSGGTGTAAAPTTPPAAAPPPAAPTSQTFNGPVSETVTFTWTSSFGSQIVQTCNATYTRTGSLRFILTTQSSGTVTGTGQLLSMVTNVTSIRCSDGTSIPLPGQTAESANGAVVQVTGTTGSLRFQEDVNVVDNSAGVAVTIRGSTVFSGSLSGGAVTGTLTDTFAMTGDSEGVSFRGNWSSTTQVTAR